VPALTIYLSRLIGIVTLIIALAMLVDKSLVVAMVGTLGQDRAALLLLGVFRVVCGAGIVLVHNVWTKGFWPLVVTLTGWALLVRGVIVLFIPPDVVAALLTAVHVADFYYVYAAIPLILGVYLSLRGFTATASSIEFPAAPASSPAPTKKPSAPKPHSRRR
jgi:hypothetical protein